MNPPRSSYGGEISFLREVAAGLGDDGESNILHGFRPFRMSVGGNSIALILNE
jgi:hypothetical protein